MAKSFVAQMALCLCWFAYAAPAQAGVLLEFKNLEDLGSNLWSIDLVASKLGSDAPVRLFGVALAVELDGIDGEFVNDVSPQSNPFFTSTKSQLLSPRMLSASVFEFPPEKSPPRPYDGKVLFTFQFLTTGGAPTNIPTLASIRPSLSPIAPIYSYNDDPVNANEAFLGTPTFGVAGATVPEPLSCTIFLAPLAWLVRRKSKTVPPK